MLVIDAYNVIHAAPKVIPGWTGELSLRAFLRLIGSSRFASGPAVLVCDGTGSRAGIDEAFTHPDAPVRVVFAGPGKDADTAIELLLIDLERAGRAKSATVVSSDRRVQAAAVGSRSRRMSSDEFLRLLVDDARREAQRAGARTGDRPDSAAAETRAGLDEDQTRFWIREFGFDPGAAGSKPPGAKPPSSAGAEPSQPRAKPAAEPEQEWGPGIDPDDLDMKKWLKE